MRPSLRPCIPFLFLGALPFSAAFRTLPHHHQGAAGGPIAGKRGPCPNMAMSASGASSCPIFKGDSKEDIALAADALSRGLPVAFPTETVYGLGAIATDDDAVGRIYEAKGRPSDNPLILHVADGEAGLKRFAADGNVPEVAVKLAKKFWPGPLSICIKANKAEIGRRASAGLDTVVLRVPSHPVALALLSALGPDVPVAAPSANASGRPSPTTAAHVLEDLGGCGLLGGIVDGGEVGCAVGIESTIVDCSDPGGKIAILRPGGVTKEEVEACLGCTVVGGCSGGGGGGGKEGEGKAGEGPKAPGMKYRHYAPNAELRIVIGPPREVASAVRQAVAGAKSRSSSGKKVIGLMSPSSTVAAVMKELGGDAEWVHAVKCGETEEGLEEWGRDLYGALRSFDLMPEIGLIIAQVCLSAPAKLHSVFRILLSTFEPKKCRYLPVLFLEVVQVHP